MTSFKEWLTLKEEKEIVLETSGDQVEGSINKLIEIMTGKKDTNSKEILTQAKGLLKSFKKGGISKDQAKWLYDTWTALKGG